MTTASILPVHSSDRNMGTRSTQTHKSSLGIAEEMYKEPQSMRWREEDSLTSVSNQGGASTYYSWPIGLGWGQVTGFVGECATVAFVLGDFSAFANWVADLQKLQRQHRERRAAVYLDATAQRLLDALDRRTSIRWEDLPDVVQAEWRDILRSVALLAGANLCEAGPTRIRLSEHADRLLAGSALADQVNSEVERRSVR